MGSSESRTLVPIQQTINRKDDPCEKCINQMKNLIQFLRFLEQPLPENQSERERERESRQKAVEI